MERARMHSNPFLKQPLKKWGRGLLKTYGLE